MYNPLRTFTLIGSVLTISGAIPIVRFLVYYLRGNGDGHIQSLVLGGALVIIGILCGLMGILADLIGANRKLLENTLLEVRRLEDRLNSRSGSHETPLTRADPSQDPP